MCQFSAADDKERDAKRAHIAAALQEVVAALPRIAVKSLPKDILKGMKATARAAKKPA